MDAAKQAAQWSAQVVPPVTAQQAFQVVGLYELGRSRIAPIDVAELRARLDRAIEELVGPRDDWAIRWVAGVRVALSALNAIQKKG